MQIVGATAPEQARQALRNAQAIVEAAGLTLGDVVKVTVFIRDMGQFAAINEVYATFFPADASGAQRGRGVAPAQRCAGRSRDSIAYGPTSLRGRTSASGPCR